MFENYAQILNVVNKGAELTKHLECDGSTRVLNYLLNEAGIEHQVYMGTAQFKTTKIPLHYWIQIPAKNPKSEVPEYWCIDNKTRMYFGDKAPQGIFWQGPIHYVGEVVDMQTTKTIFDILTYDDSAQMEELRKKLGGQ